MKQFALFAILATVLLSASEGPNLWDRSHIEQCLTAIEKQKAQGLLSESLYAKKRAMLEARLAGTFKSTALSTKDPGELNLIQNGGFEEINKNSEPNRSRWLWWGGWSWGGDYENFWATPPNVHSGKYAAGIRCKGATGRIGISTPRLPILPGTTELVLTFWGKGEGDNQIFVNFESGATGVLRQQLDPEWKQYTVRGKPEPGATEFTLYIYSIGGGTIYLDDMSLVPVGAKLD
jgi:hypothetical protein